MRKKLSYALIICSILAVQTPITSCARKSGCPATENMASQSKKKKKRAKKENSLFPKSMRRGK